MSDLHRDPVRHLRKLNDTRAPDDRLVLVRPAANELFIDIDSEADWEHYQAMMRMVRASYQSADDVGINSNWFLSERITESASGYPHCHVVLALDRDLTPMERIALQAALGSDRKRELLCALQTTFGLTGEPTLFFEREVK